jgi:hypothetical protein
LHPKEKEREGKKINIKKKKDIKLQSRHLNFKEKERKNKTPSRPTLYSKARRSGNRLTVKASYGF